MIYLTRKIEFSASHLYHNPAFSPEENRRVFGKCNNPGGHGHNYTLEVTIGGEADPQTGMVLDLVELKQILETEIMARMDHRFLNYEVAELAGKIPTCENVAAVIWQLLEPQINRKIKQGRLHRVRLWESPELFVDCYGGGGEKEGADPPHHPDRMIRGMTAGPEGRESQDAASTADPSRFPTRNARWGPDSALGMTAGLSDRDSQDAAAEESTLATSLERPALAGRGASVGHPANADPPQHPDRMLRGMTAGRTDQESQGAAAEAPTITGTVRAEHEANAKADSSATSRQTAAGWVRNDAAKVDVNRNRVSLTRRYSFAASHRLHSAELDEAANQRVYGKCNNPYGHGHNYVVEVTVAGAPDPATGMIAHLTELDRFVEREVLDPFDHKYLNEDVAVFRERVPTTENLCIEIFERLKTFPGARLEKIRVEETGKNSFEYRG